MGSCPDTDLIPNVQGLMKMDTFFPFALVGYEIDYSLFGSTRLVSHLSPHVQRAFMD